MNATYRLTHFQESDDEDEEMKAILEEERRLKEQEEEEVIDESFACLFIGSFVRPEPNWRLRWPLPRPWSYLMMKTKTMV